MIEFRDLMIGAIISIGFSTSALAGNAQSSFPSNPNQSAVNIKQAATVSPRIISNPVRLLPPKGVKIKVVRQPTTKSTGQNVSLSPKRAVVYHHDSASRTKLIRTSQGKTSKMPNLFK